MCWLINHAKICFQTGDGNIAIPKVGFGWEWSGMEWIFKLGMVK